MSWSRCAHASICFPGWHVCVSMFICVGVWVGVRVCVPSSPSPVTQSMSCPQPFQWECVLVLIPLTPIEEWQDTRGNNMALCIPDLCTDLLSSLTVKPTQVLWHGHQRRPSTVHLKLSTCLGVHSWLLWFDKSCLFYWSTPRSHGSCLLSTMKCLLLDTRLLLNRVSGSVAFLCLSRCINILLCHLFFPSHFVLI